ncbi:hypothetical protein LEM8419_01098 [Neolewinella maritima]|uniref:Polymer-forming cytoskeletal protein n=1 Tax=Neolewinella maritima TaxID=1383882 RepID=A0ABM9AZK2_9BACT|nr:polymer-forming cytoskeletal protein [Neolewinella maritima]CAH0999798.1 hypothetical protein LEM8419_01098 [Neolewinella maritima]
MFGGSKEKKSPKRERPSTAGSRGQTVTSAGGVNTIDTHTTITGDLEAGGDIRIDGKLIGNLRCQGRVIIGTTGLIEGDVDCIDGLIEGTYRGKIVAQELLTLRESSAVMGTLRARRLAMEAGCTLEGQVTVTEQSATTNTADTDRTSTKNTPANGTPAPAKA